MKIHRLFFIFVLVLLFSVNNVEAKTLSNNTPVKIKKENLQKFKDVVEKIHRYYEQPVNINELFDNALKGMVSQLDPHSAYLGPNDLKNFDIVISGKFEGIGVVVSPTKDGLKVISPIDGSPAQHAGIRTGDLIVRIDNHPIKDVSLEKAVSMIRGKIGSKVNLAIIRKHKLLKFSIERSTIQVPTVKYKLLEKHYAYIRISIFNRSTVMAMKRAVERIKLESKGRLKGLIIDLRNNPGGLLTPAVKIADMFLNAKNLGKNKLIVSIKGRTTGEEKFRATNEALLNNIPIVVLINSRSASASEIVAGALQDHSRAIVLGTKSFGKGSVQEIFSIDKIHALKLTVALYYTPSGKSIQAQGIEPNIFVPEIRIPRTKKGDALPSPLYEASLQNHIKNINKEERSQKLRKMQSNLIYEDFQLYEALTVLKGLNAEQK